MAPWLRLLLAAALSLTGLSAVAAVERVTHAQAILTPAGGAAQTTEVTLPHRWDQSFPGQDGMASYRFDIPATKTTGPRALYLPRAGNQIEVWLDERLVHHAGQLGDARTDSAKMPIWVPLPEVAHAQGYPAARMQVRVTAQAMRWGGLSTPWIGPRDEVHGLYLEHLRSRQIGAWLGIGALLLSSLMAAGFWWSQRERLYLVMCLGSAAGALRIFDRVLEQPPLPWPWWGAVSAWALLAYLVLVGYFLLMLIDRQQLLEARWFRVLLGIDLLASAAAFVLGLPWLWTLVLASLVGVAAPLWIAMAQAAWRQRTTRALAVFATGTVHLGATGFEWLMVRLRGTDPGTTSLMPYSIALLALLMSALLVRRFARVAGEHRALAVTLDERVRQREAELLRRHAELRQEYAQQAALQERQRLMRDIHDGVGVQLVGLLDLLERDALPRQVLRDQVGTALDELRMAVDALQPVHGDLTTVLATLRYRLRPRLEAAGIAIDWQVDELPPIEGLTPTTVLQIQRVLQEAFTNAMRHAQAQRLWVRQWPARAPGAERGGRWPRLPGQRRGVDARQRPGQHARARPGHRRRAGDRRRPARWYPAEPGAASAAWRRHARPRWRALTMPALNAMVHPRVAADARRHWGCGCPLPMQGTNAPAAAFPRAAQSHPDATSAASHRPAGRRSDLSIAHDAHLLDA